MNRCARFVLFVVVSFAAFSVNGGQLLNAQPSPTAILDRLTVNARRPIDFHAATFPDTVYVGQQVTYQVAVMLSESARSRLRRNPEFLPPELRGLLSYELGTPRRVAPRDYGGASFEAHVFQRALFAVAPGVLMVPAPQLSYTLPQSSSYFSREERFVVRAESAQLVVRDLPAAGRPQDFTGAVGVFKASMRLDASTARVGDPLVLTMRVDGVGNVKLLPRPVVEVSWASSVAGTERIRVDTTGALVRGYKEFDWILTPAQNGRVELPSLRYSYFNPYRGEYEYAETAPEVLTVDDGTLAATAEGDNVAVVPLRTWRGVAASSLMQQLNALKWPLLALVVLAPLPWLAMIAGSAVRRRRSSAAAGTVAAGKSAVPPRLDDSGDHARHTRRTLLGALAQRLHVAPQELVSRRDVERTLRRRGVTRETTKELVRLLDTLAEHGFSDLAMNAVSSSGMSALRSQADALLARIDQEAVTHARAIRASKRAQATFTVLLALGSLLGGSLAITATPLHAATVARQPSTPVLAPRNGGATLLASDGEPLASIVSRATALYEQRQYSRAAELFAQAVEVRPLDADLLANWGAASWAASDTVSAVISWQRAARLEPVAGDLQERLAALPSGASGGVATVPMIPVPALLLAAIIAWVIGWTIIALVRKRRDTRAVVQHESPWLGVASSIGVLVLVLAVGSGATAIWGARELDASSVFVIRRPETMRTAPGNDANAMGGVATGDVVRVEQSRGGWLRVLHADGRRGWVPAARTIPLVSSRLVPPPMSR